MTVPNAGEAAKETPDAATAGSGSSKEAPAPDPKAKAEGSGAPAPQKPEAGKADPDTKPEAADAKAEGEKGAQPKGEKAPDAKGGEEDYSKLALPKGSKLDAKDQERLVAFAKANGLGAKTVQALIEHQSKGVDAFVERQMALMNGAVNGWAKTLLEKHGEAGLKEKSELGRRFIEARSPELVKELDRTGWGQYPPFFEFVAGLAEDMSKEDKIVTGAAHETKAKKSDVEVFYPQMVGKK